MKDKRVICLDLAQLLSGAMFRGQFEERLKGIIKVSALCYCVPVLFIHISRLDTDIVQICLTKHSYFNI